MRADRCSLESLWHRRIEALYLGRSAPDDITALESVVETAKDEVTVQAFIQEHPHVLTALLGGGERYCIPKPRLGAEYVPDFLLADVDSLGIRWVLVELETPVTGVTLRTDPSQLDGHARKGVSQIQAWREWLQNNLSYAARRKTEGGRGLADVRPQAPGLVLVGRRYLFPDAGVAVRSQHREQQDITIHSYDWLIERLRGVLTFTGPPASNPFLLRADLA